MDIKRINPPIIDDEIEKLGMKIGVDLQINEDIAFVKKFNGKRLEYFVMPFSNYLAMKYLNKPLYKAIGIGGLVESKDGYIITLQKEIILKAGNISYKRNKQFSISYMGFCKVSPFSKDIIEDNLFFELEEEIGLLKEDVKVIDVKSFEENELVFIAYMKTNLDKETILRISKTAIDKWEYKEIMFVDKNHLKYFLNEMNPNINKTIEMLLR